MNARKYRKKPVVIEAAVWEHPGDHPEVDYYRHPPVDPATGEVSASDDAIGVESEQVVDPVSELAARLEEAARDAVRVTIDAMKSVIGVDLPFTPDDLLSGVGPDYWRGHAREIMDGDGE